MIPDIRVASKYLKLKQSAEDRKIEFTLSFNKLKQVMSQTKCFYTGQPIDINADQDTSYRHTIDRVDNDQGYTDNNIVACSRAINKHKGKLTVEEIKCLYNGLRKKKLI